MTRKEYNDAVGELADLIYRYALKFLRNPTAADDIVQDAFLKLWNHHKQIDRRKAKAWLFSTAHNALVNFVKRENKSQLFDGEVHGGAYREEHRFELQEVLARCLDTLPPVQKSILLLRDLEGYSYKEIGEMLELSESQVKVYLFRARKKMQSQLKGIYEYP